MHGGGVAPRLGQAALVIAFLVGVGGVIGLKALGAGAAFAIAFPVLVLSLYVLICYAGGRIAVEPDTIADNCYYLGFLYTLASLATALYQMRGVAGSAAADSMVPLVISGFGVALSSTIAGVFFRVLLLQVTQDIGALDREARQDMQAAMREMRSDMGVASRTFRAMAIEAAQQAAERQAEVDALADPTAFGGLIAELKRIERAREDRETRLLETIEGLSRTRAVPIEPVGTSSLKANH